MKKSKFYKILIPMILIFSTTVYSKTFTDQLGRKVVISKKPERIVALAPSITEIIFALKEEERLKGATLFSDYPPKARAIPRVGSYVRPELERIIALKPDLIIAVKDGNPKEIVRRLEKFKFPVFVVNPVGMESVLSAIEDIGEIIGEKESSEILVKDMKERIQKVKTVVSQVKVKPRVFFQIGIKPIVSAGKNTFIHELIELAGGKNLADTTISYPRYSVEQVVKLSPEIFIITSMARLEIFEEVKAKWSKWKHMPAVINDKIYIVDSNILDRPTPRMVSGLEKLVRIIHPDLFK